MYKCVNYKVGEDDLKALIFDCDGKVLNHQYDLMSHRYPPLLNRHFDRYRENCLDPNDAPPFNIFFFNRCLHIGNHGSE